MQPHSQARNQGKGWGGIGVMGGLPALFENRKKCPGFGKKDPHCFHLWVKFSIQCVVLRVSWRKNSKMLHSGASFFVRLTKCLSKCHISTPQSLPSDAHLHPRIIFFAKRSILNV